MPHTPRTTRMALLLAASWLALPACAAAPAPPPAQVAEAPAITLKVGDVAPPFVHGTWLKGQPVAALAKGQIYVVEFWATWCGPCKVSMPHLSELAKTYKGKATFIGVDILEKGKSPEAIEKNVAAFVKAKGDAMAYLVCRDTPDGAMYKTWMQAAGEEGIPLAFIVDGSGRIVWKGHPMTMEKVVEAVVAGTFDAAAFTKAAEMEQKVQMDIYKLTLAKDWKGVLGVLGTFQPSTKTGKEQADMWTLQAQLHLDEKAAERAYAKIIEEDSDILLNLGILIVGEEGLSKVWYARAATLLTPEVEKEPALLGKLALAQFNAGDTKAAVATKARELAWWLPYSAEKLKENPGAEGEKFVKNYTSKIEAELKRYQTAANQ